jgi:hypothetical protein
MWHIWRGEKIVQDFGGKAQRKKDHSEDQGNGIKMDVRETGWEDVE